MQIEHERDKLLRMIHISMIHNLKNELEVLNKYVLQTVQKNNDNCQDLMNIRLDLEKTKNEKIQLKTGFTVLKYEAQNNKTQREILMDAIAYIGSNKLKEDV